MQKIVLALSALMFLASCGNTSTTTTETTSGTVTTTTTTTTGTNAVANAPVVTGPSAHLDAPTIGEGNHTLQVWSDFQCPACQSANQTIMPIFYEFANAGQLKIEYHQFPLTTIHPNAFNDAMAAMCSNDQGKYSEYKEALYALELSKRGASVSDNDRIDLAEQNGLDRATFADCLNSKKYQSYVQDSMKAGAAQGVTGTPTFFLDGKRLEMNGFRTPDDLKQFVQAVIARGAATSATTTTTEVTPTTTTETTVETTTTGATE